MKLADIEKLTSETMACKQVAAVLGCGETCLHKWYTLKNGEFVEVPDDT